MFLSKGFDDIQDLNCSGFLEEVVWQQRGSMQISTKTFVHAILLSWLYIMHRFDIQTIFRKLFSLFFFFPDKGACIREQ